MAVGVDPAARGRLFGAPSAFRHCRSPSEGGSGAHVVGVRSAGLAGRRGPLPAGRSSRYLICFAIVDGRGGGPRHPALRGTRRLRRSVTALSALRRPAAGCGGQAWRAVRPGRCPASFRVVFPPVFNRPGQSPARCAWRTHSVVVSPGGIQRATRALAKGICVRVAGCPVARSVDPELLACATDRLSVGALGVADPFSCGCAFAYVARQQVLRERDQAPQG